MDASTTSNGELTGTTSERREFLQAGRQRDRHACLDSGPVSSVLRGVDASVGMYLVDEIPAVIRNRHVDHGVCRGDQFGHPLLQPVQAVAGPRGHEYRVGQSASQLSQRQTSSFVDLV